MGGDMNKLIEGRTWVLETLFRVAESRNHRIDDLMFIPTRDGQKLLLKLQGRLICEKFQYPDVKYCAEGAATESEVLLCRARVKKRLHKLLTAVPSA